MPTNARNLILNRIEPLGERLSGIHRQILERVPCVERIGCALYDPRNDLLKTFISSTRSGDSLVRYQSPLSASVSLSEMARTGECRVIDCLPAALSADSPHSRWLLEQGYQSSFTIPMLSNDQLIGFLFFDSCQAAVFTDSVQRDLVLFCNLVIMVIVAETTAVTYLLATAQAARQFVDLRDFETGAHLTRMACLSRLIARNIADDAGLDDEFVEHIYLFAPLHDIGKIGIPDGILHKTGRLTAPEWQIMQTHVNKGVSIINKVLADYQLSHLVDSRIMLNIVSGHHEYLDGSGYPAGLVGDQVSIEARITAVADIFDALTSKRPYKDAWSIADALTELGNMVAAGKIDKRCVQAIENNLPEVEEIITRWRDPENDAEPAAGYEI